MNIYGTSIEQKTIESYLLSVIGYWFERNAIAFLYVT